MVAALQEALPRHLEIWGRLLKRETRFAVGQWDGDRLKITTKILLVLCVGVEVEEVDRVLLALGPEAFASDIGANRRERVKAEAGE